MDSSWRLLSPFVLPLDWWSSLCMCWAGKSTRMHPIRAQCSHWCPISKSQQETSCSCSAWGLSISYLSLTCRAASCHGNWLCWEEVIWERGRENTQEWKPQSFNNLTSEVTSHDFCHILFIRSKLLSAAHTRGGDYIKAWLPGSWDDLGPSYSE